MNILKEKESLNKVQMREYELQKVFLFASTGKAEFSVVEALNRAKKIKG